MFGCAAIRYFRSFLDGRHVTVITDHEALKFLMSNKEAKGKLSRWQMFLNLFEIEIKHVKGTDNVAADALSRLCLDKPPVVAVLLASKAELDHEDKLLILKSFHDDPESGGHDGIAQSLC